MNLGNKNYYVNTDWLRRTFDIEPSKISDEELTELFDEVFKMLSSWYSFMPPEDNKDINVTGPKMN